MYLHIIGLFQISVLIIVPGFVRIHFQERLKITAYSVLFESILGGNIYQKTFSVPHLRARIYT